MKKLILVAFFSFIIMILLIGGCGRTQVGPAEPKQWTVMFYAAGDNDLEQAILNNIIELQKAGSTNQVNIIAQTDWWHHKGDAGTLIPGESVGRWYIEKSDSITSITSRLDETVTEINTASADAIKNFVIWTAQRYPAQHYMLVISSHGGGWRSYNPLNAQGVGQDYTTDPTKQLIISVPEIKAVLPAMKTALGKNIDLLVLDSCNNGAIELAYEFKDYVDFLVASEETIPGTGLPWDQISVNLVSNPTTAIVDIAKDMVNKYYNFYYQKYNTTLSAIDLSKISALADEVKALVLLYNTTAKDTAFTNLVNTHTGDNYTIQRYHDVTFRDLWHMADKIIADKSSDPNYADIVAKCTDIKTAVEQAVVLSKYTTGANIKYTITNSYGLSIYIPTNGTIEYDTSYDNLTFTSYTGWGTFLKRLP